jgi:hypothetical protein
MQGRVTLLFCEYIWAAYILPIISICLSLWNETSDFLVAANAIDDGRHVMGILIGITPFLFPCLIIFRTLTNPYLKQHFRIMKVAHYESFPFLQIIGHLKARFQLLQPRKELFHVGKQLILLNTSIEDKKRLMRNKAVIQSEMVWPMRRMLAFKNV